MKHNWLRRWTNLFCVGCSIGLLTHVGEKLAAQETKLAVAQEAAEVGSTMTLEELRNGGKPKPTVDEVPKARLITSAPEPIPALRYRFWPSEQELIAGDAKVYFFRTVVSFNSPERNKQFNELFVKWEGEREAGREPSPIEIRNTLQAYRLQFDELETMSLCDHQDLDMQLRNLRGSDVYAILLEEVQISRNIAKLLRWRMAAQAADGDWEGFARSARTGYRLAYLVSTGDTLIHNLVGIAITAIITEEVQRAAQYKGAPNFYWALASLPRPMFNLRPALELELSTVERTFPFLAECRKGPLPESTVQTYWESMQKTWGDVVNQESMGIVGVIGALSVEEAKANLLKRGWKSESFKEYPVMQLVLIDFDDTMRERGNQAIKYFLIDDSIADKARAKENAEFEKSLSSNNSLAGVVARFVFPAIIPLSNVARIDDYILNSAMTKEAIRMHVDQTGTLPDSLDAMENVPALLNPYSGKSFELAVKPTQQKNVVEVALKGEVPVGVDVNWLSPFLIEINAKK